MRLGFEGAIFNNGSGIAVLGRPDIDVNLRLPNLERRLRLFVTSTDVQESPADPTRQPNPMRLGMSLLPSTQLSLDLGVRAAIHPSAFASVKWAPRFDAAWLTLMPFAKSYVESNIGAGTSAGLMLQRVQQDWIVRSSSYANWQRSFTGVSTSVWSETLLVGTAEAFFPDPQYGPVADGRDIACGLLLRLYASADSQSRASAYETSLIYRRHLHGGWLFGYAEPVLRWEAVRSWRPEEGVRLGLEALISSARRASPCR